MSNPPPVRTRQGQPTWHGVIIYRMRIATDAPDMAVMILDNGMDEGQAMWAGIEVGIGML